MSHFSPSLQVTCSTFILKNIQKPSVDFISNNNNTTIIVVIFTDDGSLWGSFGLSILNASTYVITPTILWGKILLLIYTDEETINLHWKISSYPYEPRKSASRTYTFRQQILLPKTDVFVMGMCAKKHSSFRASKIGFKIRWEKDKNTNWHKMKRHKTKDMEGITSLKKYGIFNSVLTI